MASQSADDSLCLATAVTVVLLATVVVSMLKFLRRRYETFQTFKRLGIPGPEPSFLYGNLLEFKRKGHTACFADWFGRYGGPNVGYFYGCRPHLLSTDVNLLQKVLVKESAFFHMRADMNFVDKVHPISKHQLPFIRDYDKWRNIRKFVTAAFTTSRLKKMTPMLEAGVDRFLSILQTKHLDEKEFEMNILLRRLTLDNFSRAAFGINADVQNEMVALPPILRKANFYLDNFQDNLWEFFLACIKVPLQNSLLTILRWLGLTANFGDPMIEEVLHFVRARANLEDDPRQDLMRSLLNVRSSPPGADSRLNENEVTANAAILYIAGFDTTSTTLTTLLYRLTKHPEWQEKLRSEIQAAWKENADPEEKYRILLELKAMDRFILETLRMNPSVPVLVARTASYSFEHEGVRYPKGLVVQAPVFQLHHDPKLHSNPDEFDPDRFLDRIPTMGFLAFGEGPRNCVGLRFAMVQMKLTLAKLLLQFKLHTTPRLQRDGLRFVDKAFFIQPVELYMSITKL